MAALHSELVNAPEQLYRVRDAVYDYDVKISGDFYDLPYQAYDARAIGPGYRLAFAHKLVAKLTRMSTLDDGWVHRAEALHVVSVPMMTDLSPPEFFNLFAPAIAALLDQRANHPELLRYCALLLRSVSISASKLDRYTVAFGYMNRAHAHLAAAVEDFETMTVAEARQQTYLQECGQLSRNVEATLIEQDEQILKRNLQGALPMRQLDPFDELEPLRVTARASAEAGRRGTYLIDAIKSRSGLPTEPDPEGRRLATNSWFLTAKIMYMRSLLMAGLVEMCAGADPVRYFAPVPDLWAQVIEADPLRRADEPSLSPAHQMDMTRNGLIWAFLHNGDHPYRPNRLAILKKDVPKHLHIPKGGRLDTIASATALEARNHNAGILDNLAHVDTYRLLADRSGGAPDGFHAWTERRRRRLATTVDDPEASGLRRASSPTLRYLKQSASMVRSSHRFDNVLVGL